MFAEHVHKIVHEGSALSQSAPHTSISGAVGRSAHKRQNPCRSFKARSGEDEKLAAKERKGVVVPSPPPEQPGRAGVSLSPHSSVMRRRKTDVRERKRKSRTEEGRKKRKRRLIELCGDRV